MGRAARVVVVLALIAVLVLLGVLFDVPRWVAPALVLAGSLLLAGALWRQDRSRAGVAAVGVAVVATVVAVILWVTLGPADAILPLVVGFLALVGISLYLGRAHRPA